MMSKAIPFTLALAVVVTAATFVQQPSIRETGGNAIISFSVSGPTDVEVAVLNNAGKVVRHLAAGILGGDTLPPEPLASGLAQSLSWDGLDDYGRPLFSAPFRIRVRLGVTPQFDKRIHIKDAAMIAPTAYPAWSPTANNFGWGPDTVVDTERVITPSSPVLMTGMRNATTGLGTYDGGITMIDMCVSDETDDIVFQRSASFTGGSPALLCISGVTGARRAKWTGSTSGFAYGEPVMDWFGRFFLHDRGYGPTSPDLYRFTLTGTAINYSWGTNMIDMPVYSNDFVRQRGFCNDQYGNIYQAHWAAVASDPATYISKWDSVGHLIKDSLIILYTGNQGVRTDLKGNIFVGLKLKPLTDTVPQEIRGLLSGSWNTRAPFSQAAIADEAYGSIVKFGPQGGSVLIDPAGPFCKQNLWHSVPYSPAQSRVSVTGAQWVHFGSSFIFNKTPANDLNVCGCYNPRFDVDRFGRVIYPDPFQNEFRALDNNGNMIFRVHNRDLFPSVAVGSIVNVQATDRGLYLGDHVNNQIIVTTWKAEAETSLVVPTTVAERLGPNLGALGILAYPNPFTASTTLRVSGIRPRERASLRVYDISGREIVDLSAALNEGKRQIRWTGINGAGRKTPSGLYYCTLTSGKARLNKTLFLTK